MKSFNTLAGVDPVSRPELDRLTAQRRKPVIQRTLTPEGAQHVHSQEDVHCENRIRHIEERLNESASKATQGFAKAGIRGKSTHDFDRSR